MHLLTFLYVLALAGVALGQVTSPSAGAIYQAGSTLIIQWQGGGAAATIVIETGVPQYPVPPSSTTIASKCEKSSLAIHTVPVYKVNFDNSSPGNVPNTGSYTWDIPSNIAPADNYAIVIFGSSFDMSGSNFKIIASGGSTSTSSLTVGLGSQTESSSTSTTHPPFSTSPSLGGITNSKTLSTTAVSHS
jgi:hypothetical protein